MKFFMTGQKKDDCLIEVTTSHGQVRLHLLFGIKHLNVYICCYFFVQDVSQQHHEINILFKQHD